MGEDSRDDPFRNPAHGPARPPGVLEAERVDFRVTYEEQCAQNRSHYHFKTRARNTPLEELITSQPIEDSCPRCGGAVIGLPNRTVIE
ncbi:hypothetical protein [Natronorubrum sp. DTA7]|uniref:hypothetical protein n=1 Tax=Natronorubrum sp. DTA7 TaxID=3447016 RepID=UPI003F8384B8